MQKHYEITRRRVKSFLDSKRLGGKIYQAKHPVSLTTYAAPDRITFDEAIRGEYKPLTLGTQFAPLWSTHWVRVEYTIPCLLYTSPSPRD